MCFAIPKKVEKISRDTITTADGVRAKNGGLVLHSGDYVLIYGDVVVEKIPKDQAIQSLKHITISNSLI